MREILFRAKKADDGKWIEGFYARLKPVNGVMGHFINDGNSRAIKIIPETVGQFTGLYDKNGKKIFEGDIMVSRFKNDEICSTGDIQFDCGVFGVEWTINKLNKSMVGVFGQRHNLRRLDDDCIDDIEVIGNIYDNPELIKGENK